MTNPLLTLTGPILIVEDDEDDQFILTQVFSELAIDEHVHFFSNATKAMAYLSQTDVQPFLILCDINLPGITGIEFKKMIDQNPSLHKKSIPFVFFSTAASKFIVDQIYEHTCVQGFFQKKDNYQELKQSIYLVVSYWKQCLHPNSYK